MFVLYEGLIFLGRDTLVGLLALFFLFYLFTRYSMRESSKGLCEAQYSDGGVMQDKLYSFELYTDEAQVGVGYSSNAPYAGGSAVTFVVAGAI